MSDCPRHRYTRDAFLSLDFCWLDDAATVEWERFVADPAASAIFTVCDDCSSDPQTCLYGDWWDLEAVPDWLLERVYIIGEAAR